MKKLKAVLAISITLIIVSLSIWLALYHIHITKDYYGGYFRVKSSIGIVRHTSTYSFPHKPNEKELKKAKDYVYKEAKKRRLFMYGF